MKMTTTGQPPHVLIVGAGLAGMTLAQALRKKGITFEIFERDTSIHGRFQGWAIALHKVLPDMEASLPEDLGSILTTNHLLPLDVPAEFKYYVDDKLLSTAQNTKEHPLLRANRNVLRDYLAQHLDIQWGKTWTRIEESSNGVTLYFNDGTTAHGDVLVGADGVHSKVRHHIFSGKDHLNTLPLGLVFGETKLSQNEYSRTMSLGHSTFIAVNGADTQRMMTAVNSVDPSGSFANYYWSVNWVEDNVDDEGLPDTHHLTKEQLYAKAQSHITDLDPKFTEVFRLTKPENLIYPPLVIRDIVLDSIPQSRITLIGDSAHAMTPFRGEGGNIALQDSLDLARTIDKIRAGGNREEETLRLLGEYQVQMLKRSRPVVLASRAAAMGHDTRRDTFGNWSSGIYTAPDVPGAATGGKAKDQIEIPSQSQAVSV